MNPVGILIESRVTFFAVEPAFVKVNRRASVIGRDVVYGLPGAESLMMQSVEPPRGQSRCRGARTSKVMRS